jgi:hypothetical protein
MNSLADNSYAFLLFIVAAALAVMAHFGHDKDLFTFAGTVAMTGAALFHGKNDQTKESE